MNFKNNSKWRTYKGIVNNEEKVRETREERNDCESRPPNAFINVFPENRFEALPEITWPLFAKSCIFNIMSVYKNATDIESWVWFHVTRYG